MASNDESSIEWMFRGNLVLVDGRWYVDTEPVNPSGHLVLDNGELFIDTEVYSGIPIRVSFDHRIYLDL